MTKLIFLIIIGLTTLTSVTAQGFLITDKTSGTTQIIQKDPVVFNNQAIVTVEFSIWWPTSGHLFELYGGNMNSILVNAFPIPNDSCSFQIYFKESQLGEFRIANSDLDRFKKHEFSFKYIKESGQLDISLNGKTINTFIEKNGFSSLLFKVAPPRAWVPTTALHTLKFQVDGKERKKVFTFRDEDGSDVIDQFYIDNSDNFDNGGLVVGSWVTGAEYKTFPIINEQKQLMIPKIGGISIKTYLNEPEVKYHRHAKDFMTNNAYHYNSLLDDIFVWQPGLNKLVSLTDENATGYEDDYIVDTYHFGSGLAVDPVTHDLISVGGYGHYSWKNDFHRYDFSQNKWFPIDAKTEDSTFYPRNPHVFQKDSTSILIWGGSGSPTGKQGFQEFAYNDLWELNLRTAELIKIADSTFNWDIKSLVNGAYAPNENSLYLFLTNNRTGAPEERQVEKGTVNLWRVKLDDPTNPDFINSFFIDPIVPSSVRYDKKNDVLLYLTMPKHEEKRYNCVALQLPLEPYKPDPNYTIYIVSLSGIFLIILGGLGYRKIVRSKIVVEENKVTLVIGKDIQVFVDNNEVDLDNIKAKTPKYILLHLAKSADNSLTHEELQKEFWEYNTESSFKNSLNVALSTIRKILSPYGNILQNKNGKVFLTGSFSVLKTKK